MGYVSLSTQTAHPYGPTSQSLNSTAHPLRVRRTSHSQLRRPIRLLRLTLNSDVGYGWAAELRLSETYPTSHSQLRMDVGYGSTELRVRRRLRLTLNSEWPIRILRLTLNSEPIRILRLTLNSEWPIRILRLTLNSTAHPSRLRLTLRLRRPIRIESTSHSPLSWPIRILRLTLNSECPS